MEETRWESRTAEALLKAVAIAAGVGTVLALLH